MSEPWHVPDEPLHGPEERLHGPGESRSVRALVMEILRNVQDLIRSEFRLATAELVEELGRLGKGAALAGSAAIALLFGVGLLLMGAVFALALVLPLWASALIVGGVVAIVGVAVGLAGLREIRAARALKPVKTIESIRETAEWAKNRTK